MDEGTPCFDDDGDGYSEDDGDCHDGDPALHPGADEECDGVDQDCDGVVDDGTPCADDDGDGYSEDGGDCDDDDPGASPASLEVPGNGIDDDCDGFVDEADDDLDRDGVSVQDGDCDDNEPWARPGLPEDCDGIDNNCDGEEDEGCDDLIVVSPPADCGCSATPAASPWWVFGGVLGVIMLRRRRARGGLLAALLGSFAVGCSDISVREAPRAILLNPSLLDLGVVRPLEELPFQLRIDNVSSGTVTVLSVDLENDDGDAFSFVGELTPVPRQTSVTLDFVFRPATSGWFTTTVTVVSNAEEPRTTAIVRGGGGEPSPRVAPQSIDFGPVPVGETASRLLLVRNDGPMDGGVESVIVDDPAFAVTTALPLALAAGAQSSLTVTFTAPDEEPRLAALRVVVDGGAELAVALRANDCAGGQALLYDADSDGFAACAGDCDDSDDDVRPGAPETADGQDEDCDGTVDEGTSAYDDDGDGFSEDEGDCSDGDPAVHPDAVEIADNGIDDDCDGLVDSSADDPDGDGYTAAGGDCLEGDASVGPGAPELPDGIDNDCDGTIDEGTTNFDDDGDGVSEAAGDCDDTNPSTSPGAPETANGRDDDCDGLVDEGTAAADDDGDGFSELGGDCDDGDPAISPAALEVTGNAIDEDCDGTAQ